MNEGACGLFRRGRTLQRESDKLFLAGETGLSTIVAVSRLLEDISELLGREIRHDYDQA